MATRTVSFAHRVNGTLANATSVVLSNAAGSAGVIRNDTLAVVVADGTAMTNTSTGIYSHSFTDLGVAYTAYVEWVYGGETFRIEKVLAAVSSTAAFGARAGVEQKVGVINLAAYADLENDGNVTTIANAIADDLTEAATDMRIAWAESHDDDLDDADTSVAQTRWLADTNEYGAAVKAYNGRNVDVVQGERLPQQIATALDEWTRRLAMLRDEAFWQSEDDTDDGSFQMVEFERDPVCVTDEDNSD